MRFPFVTRAHHEEVVALLRDRLAEIELERRAYLDRLASVGLGGPLFSVPPPEPEVSAPQAAEAPEAIDEDYLIRAYRTRPSHMAAAVTRMLRRRKSQDAMKVARGKHIRTAIDDELDAAEEAGRRQASE